MARVSDVRLHLERAAGGWMVSSSYSLRFEPWERAAWFREHVRVLGATAAGERELATLAGPPFVPAPHQNDGEAVTLERRTPPVTLSSSALDVTPDIVFTDGRMTATVHRPDHVFVRVSVVPLLPTTGGGASPVEVRQFGFAEGVDR